MNIFKLEFKTTFKSLVLWVGITSLILILFMAFYPSMSNEAMQELAKTKLSAMPEGVLKALGISDFPDFTDIMQYYAYILQYMALAAAIYAALLGTNALIKEESDGTIEYLYAQPVTRRQITAYKLLSSVASFVLFVAGLSLVSSVLLLTLKPQNTDIIKLTSDMKLLMFGIMLSGLVFLAIGFFVSTVIKSAKQSTPLSMGIVFGTYILGMFSKTVSEKVELAKLLKYISPLDYGMPLDVLKNGFKPLNLLLAFLIIIVCISISFIVYNKKDLKV